MPVNMETSFVVRAISLYRYRLFCSTKSRYKVPNVYAAERTRDVGTDDEHRLR